MKPIIGGIILYLQNTICDSQHLTHMEQTFIRSVLELTILRHGERLINEIEQATNAIILLLLCCENMSKDLLIVELKRVYTLIIQRKMWLNRLSKPDRYMIGDLFVLPIDCLLHIKKYV